MKKAHFILDLWLENREILKQVEPLRTILSEAVERSGAKILHTHFHQFQPHGFSGFFLIAESHVSVHVWVEENLMALDILSCGRVDGQKIMDHLRKHLNPVREKIIEVSRGKSE